MKILFDVGHPGHVHLFRFARQRLLERGHEVRFVARDKEVTRALLEAFCIEYLPGSSIRPGPARFVELGEWLRNDLRIIKTHRIDLVVSTASPAAAWAARLSGIPHLSFADTETASWQQAVVKPATTQLFTPACMLTDLGPKQSRYNGTHDLAYLRPEHFTPDPGIRSELGVAEDERYAVLRFVAWGAHHDWGQEKTSSSLKRQIEARVARSFRVFISAESELPPDLEASRLTTAPSRFHDVIAFASLVVGDGSTTATEAAALGVPTLYVSTFADSLGVIRFFAKFGLLSAARSAEEGLRALDQLLEAPARPPDIARAEMLAQTIDVAEFIADRCEEYSS